MICRNCNSQINEGNNFCPNCGAQLDSNNNANEQTNNNNLILNDFDCTKFEEAYIGKNYDKLKDKTFSWSTFFLGPAYFIYRKLYTYALLYIVILFIFPASFILGIVFGFLFIRTYFNDVDNKIRQIKLKNKDLSDEELLEICRQKGGVNLVGAILFELGCILIVGIIAVIFIGLIYTSVKDYHGEYPNINEIIKEYTDDNTSEEQEELPEYSYNKEGRIGINTIIKYVVPDNYKRIEDNSEEYIYKNNNTSCNYSATLVKESTDPGDYIRKLYPEANIEDEIISIIDFKKVTIIEEQSTIYNYVTTYDGMLYEFSFKDNNDNEEICDSGRNKILGSLEISKMYEEESYSNIKDMTYEEYKNKTNNLESFILLITKTTCPHCITYKPVLNKVLSTYNLTAYNLDLDMMSTDDYKEFSSSLYFHSTPTTIFITKGRETDIGNRIIGNVPEEKIIEKLKILNYIESEKTIESSV